ncbi:MAG TPA: hypothetical protein V6D19_04755, partial [Stenomitos sp.]
MSVAVTKSDEIINVREKVISVLELLSTRMAWSSARTLLSSTSLHVSRGWDETLASARKDVYDNAIWTAAYNALAYVAHDHTYVGNKHVSFFDLLNQNEVDRTRVLTWAKESAVSNLSEYLAYCQFSIIEAPTGKDELQSFKDLPPKLIAAEYVRNKLYLQFFSTRSYTQRESLDISKMTASQQKMFREYEELIGVKTKSVPCFDTVVIDPEKALVEVRIDFQPGMTEDKNTPAFERVVAEFNRITTKFLGFGALGAGLINLHPAINPMYLDEKCGQVTALGFVATGKDSSSNNRSQIHRTKTRDFRKDEFHVGGKSQVSRIDPYAIGVAWPATPPKSDLYLELKGSARAIYRGKLSAVTVAEIVG